MTLVGRAVDGDTVDASAIGRVTDLPELCRQLGVHRLPVAPSQQFSAESLDIYRQLQVTLMSETTRTNSLLPNSMATPAQTLEISGPRSFQTSKGHAWLGRQRWLIPCQ